MLLDRSGAVLVTDFGLAQPIAGGDSPRAAAGGTAAFMAPEQIELERGPLGPATDVYGLGAVLYMLLTGRPPFVGASIDDVLDQVVSSDSPPAPHALRPLVSEKLSRLCLRCLSKSPAARFATAAAVASALRA